NIFVEKSPLINFKEKSINALKKNGDKIKIDEQDKIDFFNQISKDEVIYTEQFKTILGIEQTEQLFYRKGQRVVPKSSPLFQQFKIWQNINSLVLTNESNEKGLF